jgi:hypothetical protein
MIISVLMVDSFKEPTWVPRERRGMKRVVVRQLATAPSDQACDQLLARDQPWPHLGNVQLGGNQHRLARSHGRTDDARFIG